MEFKRGLVVLVILILSLFLIEIFTGAITGRFIFDTRAVQDTLSTSVVVIQNFPPNLTLYEPSSRVYVGDYGIWILYEVVDDSSSVSSVWFNLDNGTNMTLPLPSGGNFATSSFNSSDGDHVFYIFANDTNNNVNDSVNVNFTVVDFFDSNETFVDSDGNLIFNDTEINEFVKNISGLDPSWTINFTLYDNETPVTWEDPTGLGKKMFHFELFANTQNDTSGSFTMYFNLSQARLGSVVAEDIRGFFFNNNIWNELITTVENSDGDPLEFSVALTHLSRFLIAEKESTDGGGAGSGSGAVEVDPVLVKRLLRFLKFLRSQRKKNLKRNLN